MFGSSRSAGQHAKGRSPPDGGFRSRAWERRWPGPCAASVLVPAPGAPAPHLVRRSNRRHDRRRDHVCPQIVGSDSQALRYDLRELALLEAPSFMQPGSQLGVACQEFLEGAQLPWVDVREAGYQHGIDRFQQRLVRGTSARAATKSPNLVCAMSTTTSALAGYRR